MKKLIVMGAALLIAGSVSVRAADAKATWDKDCAKCHGTEGKGDTKLGKILKVKDFSSPKVQEEMKDEAMAKAIKDGVKEGGRKRMRAFGDLSDSEVKALVTHIRSFKK